MITNSSIVNECIRSFIKRHNKSNKYWSLSLAPYKGLHDYIGTKHISVSVMPSSIKPLDTPISIDDIKYHPVLKILLNTKHDDVLVHNKVLVYVSYTSVLFVVAPHNVSWVKVRNDFRINGIINSTNPYIIKYEKNTPIQDQKYINESFSTELLYPEITQAIPCKMIPFLQRLKQRDLFCDIKMKQNDKSSRSTHLPKEVIDEFCYDKIPEFLKDFLPVLEEVFRQKEQDIQKLSKKGIE